MSGVPSGKRGMAMVRPLSSRGLRAVMTRARGLYSAYRIRMMSTPDCNDPCKIAYHPALGMHSGSSLQGTHARESSKFEPRTRESDARRGSREPGAAGAGAAGCVRSVREPKTNKPAGWSGDSARRECSQRTVCAAAQARDGEAPR